MSATRTSSLGAALFLVVGCGPSSSPGLPPIHADAGDAGLIVLPKHDGGGHDATTDGGPTHPSEAGTGTSEGGASEAGPTDAGPVRTLTTRALLPTVVDDLLLDPFMTSDTSWGHFRAVVPAVTPAETGGDCPYIVRDIVSSSPSGVAGPVVTVNPLLTASTGCTAILAPFSGSSGALNAQIWVSLDGVSGAASSVPTVADAGDASVTDGGAATIAATVTVALIPNAVPAGTAVTSFPFVPLSVAPEVIGGRQWVLLGLAAPVAAAQGGWFAITFTGAASEFYLASPEVVPTAAGQIHTRPNVAWQRPATELERGAVLQYGRVVHQHHPSRRRARPRR